MVKGGVVYVCHRRNLTRTLPEMTFNWDLYKKILENCPQLIILELFYYYRDQPMEKSSTRAHCNARTWNVCKQSNKVFQHTFPVVFNLRFGHGSFYFLLCSIYSSDTEVSIILLTTC